MATVRARVHESPVGAIRGLWAVILSRLERVSLLLVVAAYVVVYTVLLFGAAIGALYLGTAIPGVAGAVAFLTVGLVIIASAPTGARRLFERVVDLIETPRES